MNLFKELMQPKVLLLFLCILAGVVSCTSCRSDNVTPPKPVPTVVVPPIPTNQSVESKKSSVIVPIEFQDQHPDIQPNSDYRLYANMSGKELISLDSQVYTSSYEEFVLEGIRSVRDQGGVVQSSEKVNINGQDMAVVESSKDGVIAWFWMTTKNGIGYTFTCGGPESSGQSLRDLCFGIANTFSIK
jgi:hypothetical protein